ncbi:ABC-type multidrug transport system, permease component [Candidatus Scalindua japonica]|uniref:ABC-type multidrug transport system, permease component n=1 Tax=Candidatus Scalindua japonica TaxID=1284222 RepID=A0A286TW10_9BACT|nr:hypothetical protein [Candidatus Scalindua japonica]GAX60077.1 ABC-type multidrug transport system, permease component [Candidatus Scalindua japonica]
MNINTINNSQFITEAFTKGVSKLNNSDVLAFNNTSKKLPFGKALYDETVGVKNSSALKHPQKHFMPLNKYKVNPFPENFFESKGVNEPSKSSVIEQYKMYKEDQLLSNPGGDNFFLNKSDEVIDKNFDHSSITMRVGKDLADAGNNLLNAVKDLGIGAKIKYVDKHGNIRDGRKVGLAGTVVNFFKDVASGLSFGLYNPDGEPKPHGGIGRIKHLFKKIFKDALVGDIVKGVPKSAIHVGEDIIFAGLNAVEAVPDATIGNIKAGRKVTTALFDNTQVVMDFVMDVIPGGDASMRTRSFKLSKGFKGLPIINNITTPEVKQDEKEWKYVRNTSFRKIIETIPSLIPFRM